MTMLMRPASGRKRGGMLCQVLRPIRTALRVGCGCGCGVVVVVDVDGEVVGGEGGGCLVRRAK